MNPYTARAMIKDPAAFIGRAAELHDIYTLLAAMQSCSVVGPRRIGKSSLLYHLTHLSTYSSYLPNPEPYVFAFVDLQELAGLGPEDFFFTAVERLCQASNGRLERDPTEYGTLSGFRRFLMQATDAGLRLVLCCDEFEMLSQNPCFSADFFTYLRGLCSNYDLALVTSSRASLFDLCYLGNLQTSQFWNIFVERALRLMPGDEARTLISEPFKHAAGVITDEDVTFVLKLAGRHPFFIQVACYYLFEAQAAGGLRDHSAVEHRFLDEARRYYAYAWKQLDGAEQAALVTLLRTEGHSIEPAVFQRLKRSVLVSGSPESPSLISAGWQRFIESEVQTTLDAQPPVSAPTESPATVPDGCPTSAEYAPAAAWRVHSYPAPPAPPTGPIRQLANLIRARREAGDRPYTLLLGSSLSLTPEVRQAVCGSDDWEAFGTAIQRLSAAERRALLAGPLDGLNLTPGYRCLAELAQTGCFNIILTANIDDALDNVLRTLPASECQVLCHGRTSVQEIVEALSRPAPRVKAVKLRGDVNAYKLPLTPEGQFEFPKELEEAVEQLLSQDTILVGDISNDNDIQRCIRQGESALWLAVPEEPRPGSFLYKAKQARPKGDVITGVEAEFVSFFSALAHELEMESSQEKPRKAS